jgi:hypothetical protein
LSDTYDYNQLINLEQVPYNIACLLFDDEIIWKLLKYDDTNALDMPNVSDSDKIAMFYDGSPMSTDYKVFFTPFMDDTYSEQCSMLRIYPEYGVSNNRTDGVINIKFEILSHVKSQQLSDNFHQTRPLRLLVEIIRTLNGQEVGGLGRLTFNRTGDYGNYRNHFELNLSNNRNFTGYTLTMSTMAM